MGTFMGMVTTIHILQTKKQQCREVRWLAKGHTARKKQSRA